MLELNVIQLLNLMDSQTQSVTRYRVTIDFTVINRGNPPSDWNWRNL